MLTPEEDMEIEALKKRGWSISAIARHLGRDRKTIRAYLAGDRQPGADGRLPSIGNTVDVATATWKNTIGDPELIAVWNDPDFDPAWHGTDVFRGMA